MKVIFDYDKAKDVWCLLNKGKGSNNSATSTKVYELLVAGYGENPNEQNAADFIDKYFAENAISLDDYEKQYATEWSSVSDEYHKRAKAIFRVSLPQDVTAYLTVNNRNPYSIADNLFYVTVPRETVRKTVMHELWHFYTWYGLGTDQEATLGKQKYNDIKEALTVLLNEECGDLLPDGVYDGGYPQHQILRDEIKAMWGREKDIHRLWKRLISKENLLSGNE